MYFRQVLSDFRALNLLQLLFERILKPTDQVRNLKIGHLFKHLTNVNVRGSEEQLNLLFVVNVF